MYSYVAVSFSPDDVIILSCEENAEEHCFNDYAVLLKKGIPQKLWKKRQITSSLTTTKKEIIRRNIRSQTAKARRRKNWRQKKKDKLKQYSVNSS